MPGSTSGGAPRAARAWAAPLLVLGACLLPLSFAASPGGEGAGGGAEEGKVPGEGAADEAAGEELAELRRRVAELGRQLERERAERTAAEEELRARVLALRAELTAASEERISREREWLGYTRMFASLLPSALPAELLFRPQLPADELEILLLDQPGPSEPAPGRTERDREVFLALRSLLTLEGVDGLELLESGRVGSVATGPVVLRMIDRFGRPSGTLAAERLRFEASRAARTLTLVLEEGYERAGSRRIAFEGAPEGADRGGVRRIHLGRVDPAPWIRALPELFRPADREAEPDDGRWDLLGVRLALNALLEREGLGGTWRLRSIGGIAGGELRDVMLEQRDGTQTVRQLVADRLRLLVQERGMLLLLEGGAQIVDGRKLPFLDGRYRIFLPRAEPDAWRRAGLPGLVAEPPPALSRPHAAPRG